MFSNPYTYILIYGKYIHMYAYICMTIFMYMCFNTKSQTFGGLVRKLLYADYADFVSHSERGMHDIMSCFSAACDTFGLTISIKKTKVMIAPAPGAPYIEPNIYVRERRHICVLR